MSQTSQQKKNQDTEIILIDEEEEAQPTQVQRRKEYPLPGIAQRIFNKQTLPSGQVKYLVKWQGYSEEDATWETDQIMREKHNELIQDYEFYVLTGERLEGERSQAAAVLEQQSSGNKMRAIKQAGRSVQSYKKDDHTNSDQEKKRKQDSPERNLPSTMDDKILRTSIEPFEDFNLNVKSSVGQIQSDVNEMVDKQFKQMSVLKIQFTQSEILNKLIANPQDKIENVKLTRTNDDKHRLIFTVDWRNRTNGDKPYSEYYSYQQLSQLCPYMGLKFLENQLFGVKDDALNIQFSCQGQSEEERHCLIFQAINPTKTSKNETFKNAVSDLIDINPLEPNMVLVEQEDPEVAPQNPVIESQEQKTNDQMEDQVEKPADIIIALEIPEELKQQELVQQNIGELERDPLLEETEKVFDQTQEIVQEGNEMEIEMDVLQDQE